MPEITRRDFLNGAALTVASGLTPLAAATSIASSNFSGFVSSLTRRSYASGLLGS